MRFELPPLKPIPGWEGLYAASADGHIWSLPRSIVTKAGWVRMTKLRRMKRQRHNRGYWTVHLCSGDGTQQKQLVHRLVALAWVENADPTRTEVNHKDSNRANARANNLEWVTSSENHLHAWRQGGRQMSPMQIANGAKAGRSRRLLNADQVAHVRQLAAAGTVQRRIAERFGVCPATVCQIVNNRRYQSA